jgi:hypothetical protein
MNRRNFFLRALVVVSSCVLAKTAAAKLTCGVDVQKKGIVVGAISHWNGPWPVDVGAPAFGAAMAAAAESFEISDFPYDVHPLARLR